MRLSHLPGLGFDHLPRHLIPQIPQHSLAKILRTLQPSATHLLEAQLFALLLLPAQPFQIVPVASAPGWGIFQPSSCDQCCFHHLKYLPFPRHPQMRKTTINIILKPARLHYPRSHRIEMNVMTHRPKRIIIQQDRLVAPLKYMPAFLAKTIEAIREGALQPTHSLHQIRFRRFQAQVIVVAHQYPCMQPPAHPFACFLQTLQKAHPRSLALKDPTAVIPTIDHMVACPSIFYPYLPSHLSTKSTHPVPPCKQLLLECVD